MATLADICDKPFSEMTSEELQERLRVIRRNRRAPAAPTVKTKAPKSTIEMTPEEAAAMLELLGVDSNA